MILLTCFSLLLVATTAFGFLWHRSFSRYAPPIRGDVLLVFAHPDDEAMFFTPLLMYLKRINVKAHFLCLSNGNFAGLGLVREKELVASAKFYGIEAASVTTINDERLPDGMRAVWDSKVVAQIIRHTMTSASSGGGGAIRTVVTFDKHGVSSHPNHISVHNGVALLAKQMASEGDHTTNTNSVLFLQLHTRSLYAKYVGPLALIPYLFGEGTVHPNSFSVGGRSRRERLGRKVSDDVDKFGGDENAVEEEYDVDARGRKGSALSSSRKHTSLTKYSGGSLALPWAIIARPKHAMASLEGLKRHTSQLVWFRYLFVFFSTYGYVNELERIDADSSS